MKIKNILFCIASLSALSACNADLKDNLSKCSVELIPSDSYTIENNIITVKKGETVNFSILGNPQFLTFFSGEKGHQYSGVASVDIQMSEVLSSNLVFNIWSQYGVAATYTECPQLDLFYAVDETDPEGTVLSEPFPGMSKTDFEADSVLVRNFDWKTLVDRSKLPQTPLNNVSKALSYSIPVTDYIGKNFCLAIAYNNDEYERTQMVDVDVVKDDGSTETKQVEQTVAQPTFYIAEMRLETLLKDGTLVKNYASSFGFTPLNLDCSTKFKDQNENNMPQDRAYGSTQLNVSGLWNLTDIQNGNFAIRGTAAGDKWKKSWLVSDRIDILRRASLDTGVAVKGIATEVDSFEYAWEKVGTYTVTFVMKNVNYAYAEDKVREFIVNVTD